MLQDVEHLQRRDALRVGRHGAVALRERHRRVGRGAQLQARADLGAGVVEQFRRRGRAVREATHVLKLRVGRADYDGAARGGGGAGDCPRPQQHVGYGGLPRFFGARLVLWLAGDHIS